MGNAQLIARVTASRLLPAKAAIIAVATAYQESNLRITDVQLDHDSEGLFQLRVGLWTKPVADDCVIPPAIPVKALSGLVFERDGMLHRIRLAVTAPAPIEFFFISSDRVSPATTNLNS